MEKELYRCKKSELGEEVYLNFLKRLYDNEDIYNVIINYYWDTSITVLYDVKLQKLDCYEQNLSNLGTLIRNELTNDPLPQKLIDGIFSGILPTYDNPQTCDINSYMNFKGNRIAEKIPFNLYCRYIAYLLDYGTDYWGGCFWFDETDEELFFIDETGATDKGNLFHYKLS